MNYDYKFGVYNHMHQIEISSGQIKKKSHVVFCPIFGQMMFSDFQTPPYRFWALPYRFETHIMSEKIIKRLDDPLLKR